MAALMKDLPQWKSSSAPLALALPCQRAYAQRKNWSLESISVEVEIERFQQSEYPAYTGDAPYVNEVREHISYGDRSPTSKKTAS